MDRRISTLIRVKKLTASEFAHMVGVQPSSISHILSGRNKPSLDFVLRILKTFPEINSDWLLLGQGDMLRKVTTMNQKDMSISISDIPLTSNSNLKPPVTMDKGQKEEREMIEKDKKDGILSAKNKEKITTRVTIFFNDHTFSEYFPEKP